MKALILTACLLCLTASASRAATYVVRPDGTGDYPTIQAAIDARINGDVVELADGTYTGYGNRDISYRGKAITVRSQNGPAGCVIDSEGSPAEPHRAFLFNQGEGPSATLRGVKITGGWTTLDAPFGPAGGGCGIYESSSPTLVNCTFENNTSLNNCGAFDVYGDGCSPTFIDCTFIRNKAVNRVGGAGCVNGGSEPTFRNCEFSDNTAQSIGGVLVMASNTRATFELCTFNGNEATGPFSDGGVGAAWVGYSASAHFVDCDFTDNVARGAGGGLGVGTEGSPPAEITVDGCTFTRNHADLASGGMFAVYGSTATVTNCNFYFNSAGVRTGAVSVTEGGTASLSSCTLVGNASPTGALGIGTADASMTIENSIVAFSTQGGAATGESRYTLNCCDIYGNMGGDYVGPIATFIRTDGNIAENPQFCNPGINDFTLGAGSPCASEHAAARCGLIGAWPVGCPSADPTTWGALKASFK